VLITFLWTPPHFWALALYRSDDYARAGVPMMPVVRGKPSTRQQILGYALVLFPAGLIPAAIGLGGPLYAAAATLFGGWLVFDAFAVLREKDQTSEPAARRLFGVSILYLFVLFATLIAEHLLGIAPVGAASFGAWM
jgi:protoheme IX farnesyltransferase